jgi:hypothetical protein
VEVNSTGGQALRRAVAPSDDDDGNCFQCLVVDYQLRSDDCTYAVICNNIMRIYM